MNFYRMLPRECSYHLGVPSLPKSHGFSMECKDPNCSNIPPKEMCLPLLALWILLGRKKSFDESPAKCLSHPALALDNDIPPAIAKSSGAEDKCHFQLSVMRSAFDYIVLMVVCVSNYILSFLICPVNTVLLLRLGWLLPGYRTSTWVLCSSDLDSL